MCSTSVVHCGVSSIEVFKIPYFQHVEAETPMIPLLQKCLTVSAACNSGQKLNNTLVVCNTQTVTACSHTEIDKLVNSH